MNIHTIIEKKRDAIELSRKEISFFIEGILNKDISEIQTAGMLMAIYINGMSLDETYNLTHAMVENSQRFDRDHHDNLRVDKHSTGGVGDKVSLMLVPLLASCGLQVPMISGRGLGHTGGTLDKLESIPGFCTNIDFEKAVSQLNDLGAIFLGQSQSMVPADRILYSLRDHISTIRSVPLITSSILSKKIIENIDALVIDIKIGQGAFYKSVAEAGQLVMYLNGVAQKFNIKLKCIFTQMDQPLGYTIGNWLEVTEVVNTLKNKMNNELALISRRLGAELLCLVGESDTINDGISVMDAKILSGDAFNKFLEIVEAQGGDVDYILENKEYKKSRKQLLIKSDVNGYIHHIDALKLGLLSMELGAGRKGINDGIDFGAGLVLHVKTGDYISRGQVIMEVLTDKELDENDLEREARSYIRIEDQYIERLPIILE